MNKDRAYRYWHVEIDEKQVMWLEICTPGASQNTLNAEALNELNDLLNIIKQQQTLAGVVFFSRNPKSFLAGANVDYFSNLSAERALEFVALGQAVIDTLASLTIPTIAMVTGYCLGGGLELALACRYLIVEEESRLGLPEVKLGILPAWGGIRRLCYRAGALTGLQQIVQGKMLTGSQAYRQGIVDASVPMRQLRAAVDYYLNKQPSPYLPSRLKRFSHLPFVRPLLAKLMRTQMGALVNKEHYPAPYQVVDIWEKAGLQAEKSKIAELKAIEFLIEHHQTAKNLIRLFHLSEQMKSLGKGDRQTFQHLHVVGAGVMGGDIAIWSALKGLKVTLQDNNPQAIAATFKRAYALYQKVIKKPRLVQAALDRLIPDPKGCGIPHADIIIEAIVENLPAKQALFERLEKTAQPQAILATNTSSILLEDIGKGMQDPKRLVGLHFFNPVSRLELLEVVRGDQTADAVYHAALGFVHQMGKLPLPVKSRPGFLVNRLLMPYLLEAMKILDEGVTAPVIDKIVKSFGMPMGPIELADAVGLDICLAVAKNLTKHFGGTIPPLLETLVSQGFLGRKTNRGFYEYRDGKPVREGTVAPISGEANLIHRLMMRMLNEASVCWREQVVERPEYIDVAMVFGAGFAPFRSGLIQYANTLGAQKIDELSARLSQEYGDRFRPDQGLEKLLLNSNS